MISGPIMSLSLAYVQVLSWLLLCVYLCMHAICSGRLLVEKLKKFGDFKCRNLNKAIYIAIRSKTTSSYCNGVTLLSITHHQSELTV